jgi:hypothetical protein
MLTIQAYTRQCVKCARQFLSSNTWGILNTCPICKATLGPANLETVAIRASRGYPRAMEQARDDR